MDQLATRFEIAPILYGVVGKFLMTTMIFPDVQCIYRLKSVAQCTFALFIILIYWCTGFYF